MLVIIPTVTNDRVEYITNNIISFRPLCSSFSFLFFVFCFELLGGRFHSSKAFHMIEKTDFSCVSFSLLYYLCEAG